MTPADAALLAAAGLAAGSINGAAGGGSLVSFPALLLVGYPSLTANVTSTIGIWPGYLGGAAGYRSELAGQRDRFRALAIVSIAGAALGAVLLLITPTKVFSAVVPWLILFACGLLAAQPFLAKRLAGSHRGHRSPLLQLGTFLGAAYGAYFGAGLGVVLLAVFGLFIDDQLVRLNGLRGAVALLINTIAVLVYVVVADVAWSAVALLAPTSLVGGYVGARLARRLHPNLLRALVITFGVAAALRLLWA